MMIPLVFVAGCLYYLMFKAMEQQLGIPEYIAHNLTPVVHKINFILMVGIPPLFALLIMWGVVLSHRFAGPLERLEKELDRVIKEGHYHLRVKVRRHDDLKPIAETVNKLLDALEERRK